MYLFVLVDADDTPLLTTDFTEAPPPPVNTGNSALSHQHSERPHPPPLKEDAAHLNRLSITHASLDMVDQLVWGTQAMYLKVVDKFNEHLVSAYVTAGHARLMMLHDAKNEEKIRSFFGEVHEAYARARVSPFWERGRPLPRSFVDRVRSLGRFYFL